MQGGYAKPARQPWLYKLDGRGGSGILASQINEKFSSLRSPHPPELERKRDRVLCAVTTRFGSSLLDSCNANESPGLRRRGVGGGGWTFKLVRNFPEVRMHFLVPVH